LKPLDKDKVIDVLKKAHDSLMDKKMEEERNKNLKKKLELNLSLSRDKILQDLLRERNFLFRSLTIFRTNIISVFKKEWYRSAL